MTTYTLVYPPAHNDTYVKATTKFATTYWPYFATDPAKSLTGDRGNNEWGSGSGSITNQRFHIDLGSSKIIRRIYYENSHHFGTDTSTGAKNFALQGSNEVTAFSELAYATDTNWTTIGTYQFDIHVSADQVDPKYILIANTVAYRYYAMKISDCWGGGTYSFMALRRLVLQTEDGYTPEIGGFIPRVIIF